jgi:hypothetical protein
MYSGQCFNLQINVSKHCMCITFTLCQSVLSCFIQVCKRNYHYRALIFFVKVSTNLKLEVICTRENYYT